MAIIKVHGTNAVMIKLKKWSGLSNIGVVATGRFGELCVAQYDNRSIARHLHRRRLLSAKPYSRRHFCPDKAAVRIR